MKTISGINGSEMQIYEEWVLSKRKYQMLLEKEKAAELAWGEAQTLRDSAEKQMNKLWRLVEKPYEVTHER